MPLIRPSLKICGVLPNKPNPLLHNVSVFCPDAENSKKILDFAKGSRRNAVIHLSSGNGQLDGPPAEAPGKSPLPEKSLRRNQNGTGNQHQRNVAERSA
ncbi:hypothetical protein ABQ153_19860 [Xanthomonas sp. WHRI 8356]|uniref:hypothetical protein n=1 Tax=Xanthomonas hortorum TaxID=56454 RepID=UPI001A3587C6|nr:hypothetical protein [Xanthomonas hortorum]MBG3852311.1 hypothetical protein [Xanthomonas hortorum pv. carotae]UTS72117.1 hypothetical protein NMB96_16620 [Xanthomonas hortorum]